MGDTKHSSSAGAASGGGIALPGEGTRRDAVLLYALDSSCVCIVILMKSRLPVPVTNVHAEEGQYESRAAVRMRFASSTSNLEAAAIVL